MSVGGQQGCWGHAGRGHLTLPQSRCEDDVAEAIFAFFLLSFSFSPASTTSLASFRHSGQYLSQWGHQYPCPRPTLDLLALQTQAAPSNSLPSHAVQDGESFKLKFTQIK